VKFLENKRIPGLIQCPSRGRQTDAGGNDDAVQLRFRQGQCLLLIDLRRLLPVGIFPKPVI
jgi:hypothetical protein